MIFITFKVYSEGRPYSYKTQMTAEVLQRKRELCTPMVCCPGLLIYFHLKLVSLALMLAVCSGTLAGISRALNMTISPFHSYSRKCPLNEGNAASTLFTTTIVCNFCLLSLCIDLCIHIYMFTDFIIHSLSIDVEMTQFI